MRTKLNDKFSYNKTLLILSLLCILCACLSVVFGELAVVAVTAFLAAIFVFESKQKRIFSFVIPVIVIAINVGTILLMQSVFSVWGVVSIVSAFVIYYGYVKGAPKFDTALIVAGIIALFTVLSLLFAGMLSANEFSLEASINFYEKLYSLIREDFSKSVVEIYSQIAAETKTEPITIDEAGAILDTMVNLLIAVLAVISFFVTGLCYKLFGAILKRFAAERDALASWRFVPPAFFGHFYMVLMIAYFLLSRGDGVLAITVANLYLIFMWIYAYVGARILYLYLSEMKSKGFAIFVIGIGMLLLSSLSMQLLAIIGAFYTSRQINEASSDN